MTIKTHEKKYVHIRKITLKRIILYPTFYAINLYLLFSFSHYVDFVETGFHWYTIGSVILMGSLVIFAVFSPILFIEEKFPI